MLPSPSEIRYFLEIEKTSNISRAAERLGVSQPSLSLALKRLETTLGAKLFIRSKTGVKLTSTGLKFASRAKMFLEVWGDFKRDALHNEESLRGSFSIGCHPAVALYSLPTFLPELFKDCPEIEIELHHELSRKITEQVINFKTDFGIVVNPVSHPDLVIKTLCKDEVCFWTKNKNPKDVLICHPDLMQTDKLLSAAEKKGLRFKKIIHTPQLELIGKLVTSGVGIGILPERVATAYLHEGILPLMKSELSLQDRICLVYRADVQTTRAAKEVIKRILEARI